MIINCYNCSKKLPVPDASFRNVNPKIKCPYCNTSFLAKKENTEIKSSEITEKVVVQNTIPLINQYKINAWLVVHDENTNVQTFQLNLGKNIIGRKSTSKPCDIMIETEDNTMSRNHFCIEVKQNNNGYSFILSDFNSTNATFINTKSLLQLKNDDEYLLQDNDLIQAGKTKIVFKATENQQTNETVTTMVTEKPRGTTVKV